MKLGHALLKELRVPPGERPHLDVRPTSGAAFLGDKAADRDLKGLSAELERAQELLYSTESRALLVVLQGLDASGKDGTIKHVMSGVNPQGARSRRSRSRRRRSSLMTSCGGQQSACHLEVIS